MYQLKKLHWWDDSSHRVSSVSELNTPYMYNVPVGGSSPVTLLKTNSRPGHLQVGNDVIDKHCITLDFLVQFNLWVGIRAGLTKYIEWFQAQKKAHLAHIALSDPMTSIRPAGPEPRFVPDLPLPNPHY